MPEQCYWLYWNAIVYTGMLLFTTVCARFTMLLATFDCYWLHLPRSRCLHIDARTSCSGHKAATCNGYDYELKASVGAKNVKPAAAKAAAGVRAVGAPVEKAEGSKRALMAANWEFQDAVKKSKATDEQITAVWAAVVTGIKNKKVHGDFDTGGITEVFARTAAAEHHFSAALRRPAAEVDSKAGDAGAKDADVGGAQELVHEAVVKYLGRVVPLVTERVRPTLSEDGGVGPGEGTSKSTLDNAIRYIECYIAQLFCKGTQCY